MWYSNLLNNYNYFEKKFNSLKNEQNNDEFDDNYYDALHNYGDGNVFMIINLIKNKV